MEGGNSLALVKDRGFAMSDVAAATATADCFIERYTQKEFPNTATVRRSDVSIDIMERGGKKS